MYADRFDAALLSLFTIEQLTLPFTVVETAPYVWYVYQDGQPLGRVQKRHGYYVSDKVQFIPVEKK